MIKTPEIIDKIPAEKPRSPEIPRVLAPRKQEAHPLNKGALRISFVY